MLAADSIMNAREGPRQRSLKGTLEGLEGARLDLLDLAQEAFSCHEPPKFLRPSADSQGQTLRSNPSDSLGNQRERFDRIKADLSKFIWCTQKCSNFHEKLIGQLEKWAVLFLFSSCGIAIIIVSCCRFQSRVLVPAIFLNVPSLVAERTSRISLFVSHFKVSSGDSS